MNRKKFQKLLSIMTRYYFKLYEDIHYSQNRSTREITNIRDSNYIRFRDNPHFARLLTDLTEEQSHILDEKIAIEEEKTRRRLRLTSILERGIRRNIEERPHNFPSTISRSRSRNNSSNGSRTRSRNNSSNGGRKIRTRKI